MFRKDDLAQLILHSTRSLPNGSKLSSKGARSDRIVSMNASLLHKDLINPAGNHGRSSGNY
ncbi:MAG TPA: hypothetical protein V6C84_12930 [Coleofasciculaceae cyanobacterium]